jgi:hypothetical protein
MDNKSFDRLVRIFAGGAGHSRRGALRTVIGGLGLLLGQGPLRETKEAAARRRKRVRAARRGVGKIHPCGKRCKGKKKACFNGRCWPAPWLGKLCDARQGPPCRNGSVCLPSLNGVETCQCPTGTSVCGTNLLTKRCIDLQTDAANCGACGAICLFGDTTCCGGLCVDATSDPKNCGRCGNDCGSENCVGGACVNPCAGGLSNCDGQCVDLRTDPQHCGRCDRDCTRGETCINAQCVVSCAAGLSNCSGHCVDLHSDPQHCGGCTRVCGPGQACCASVCTDLASDFGNCGRCGRGCRSDERCQDGTCVANPNCVPYGEACAGPNDCCAGIPCNNNHCVFP